MTFIGGLMSTFTSHFKRSHHFQLRLNVLFTNIFILILSNSFPFIHVLNLTFFFILIHIIIFFNIYVMLTLECVSNFTTGVKERKRERESLAVRNYA